MVCNETLAGGGGWEVLGGGQLLLGMSRKLGEDESVL